MTSSHAMNPLMLALRKSGTGKPNSFIVVASTEWSGLHILASFVAEPTGTLRPNTSRLNSFPVRRPLRMSLLLPKMRSIELFSNITTTKFLILSCPSAPLSALTATQKRRNTTGRHIYTRARPSETQLESTHANVATNPSCWPVFCILACIEECFCLGLRDA